MSRFIRIAVAVAALAGATAASAGMRYVLPVMILKNADGTVRGAHGSMGSTRNTADATSYITCDVRSYQGYGTTLWCQARDTSGAMATCSSMDPTLLQAASAITSDSILLFEFDSAGKCYYLAARAGSYLDPKRP